MNTLMINWNVKWACNVAVTNVNVFVHPDCDYRLTRLNENDWFMLFGVCVKGSNHGL